MTFFFKDVESTKECTQRELNVLRFWSEDEKGGRHDASRSARLRAPADMKARIVQTRFIFSSSAKHTRGVGVWGADEVLRQRLMMDDSWINYSAGQFVFRVNKTLKQTWSCSRSSAVGFSGSVTLVMAVGVAESCTHVFQVRGSVVVRLVYSACSTKTARLTPGFSELQL